MKKRIIIILSCILAVAVAAVAVILFVGPNSGRNRLEDLDCPYEYEVKKELNRIVVTVSGQEEGFTWEGETERADCAVVTSKYKRNGEAVFTVKPLMDGRDCLDIILRDDSLITNAIFMIQVTYDIVEDKITATECTHRELGGAMIGKQNSYILNDNGDDTFSIGLGPIEGGVWQGYTAEGQADIIRENMENYIPEEEETEGEETGETEPEFQSEWFTIEPLSGEEIVVIFCVYGHEEYLEIHIGRTEEGRFTIVSHEMLTQEP